MESSTTASQYLHPYQKSGNLRLKSRINLMIFPMTTPENMPDSSDEQTISESKEPKLLDEPKVKSPDAFIYATSIVVALMVFLSTAFFYWENRRMDAKIQDIRSKTQEYQEQIEVLKKDPNVRAWELFFGQKDAISRSINKSNAANYIREMEKIEKDFGLYFNGFSFSQDRISTGVTVQKGVDTDAIQKIIKFIASYRTPAKSGSTTGSGSQFLLNPVLSVSGDEEKRNISVDFKIK